jgi:isopentenyl-diphosphate delta-isomerase
MPTLIASGGIGSGTEVALCIGLGANIVGAARPILQAQTLGGVEGVVNLLTSWETTLRQWMFLTGSADIASLRSAPIIQVSL